MYFSEYQHFSKCFSISYTITILLGHFHLCTVPLENSNAANKPRIVSIRFSKFGSSNMSVFTPVLDFYADIIDTLWTISYFLQHHVIWRFLLRHQRALSLKKNSGNHKELAREKKFTTWSCASLYPINGIWPTDWLTDSCLNCTMPPLLQVSILLKNKMSE